MKRTTKSLLITSLILFCAGLILALASSIFVKAKGIDAFGVKDKTIHVETLSLSLEDVLTVSPDSNYVKKLSDKYFLKVDITSFTGDVVVRTADEPSLELIDTNTNNLHYEIVGETLTISEVDSVGFMGIYIDKEGFSFKGLRQIFGPGNSTNSKKKIVLNLPKEMELDQVIIDSKIGDVEIEKVSIDNLIVSSFSGNVLLADLPNAEGKIEIKGNATDVEIQSSTYKSCSVTTKIGNIKTLIHDVSSVSTVLESWLGKITILSDEPTSSYKLTLSTVLGNVSRNGESFGKSLRENSSNANRITSSLILGDISIAYTGEEEDAPSTLPETLEPTTSEEPSEPIETAESTSAAE